MDTNLDMAQHAITKIQYLELDSLEPIRLFTQDNSLFFKDAEDVEYKVATGNYLSIDGGTLNGPLSLSNHSINDTLQLELLPNNTPVTPASGIALFSQSSKLFYRDDTGTNYELGTTTGNYLPLSGGTMDGSINMDNNDVLSIRRAVLMLNNAPSNPPTDSIALFTQSSKLFYRDDTGTDYELGTTSGNYLPLGGGTMTGNINMDSHAIANVSSLSMLGNLNMGNQSITNTLAVNYLETIATAPFAGINLYYNGTLSYINSESLITEVATVANTLALSGGTMTGDINMNENNITKVSQLGMLPTTEPSTPTEGVSMYSNVGKLFYRDDQGNDYELASTDMVNGYLPLLGGIMEGNIAMNNNALTYASEVILSLNTSPTQPLSDALTLFTSAKHLYYRDDTGTDYEVSTGVNLPLAGGIMSGDINMDSNDLWNVRQTIMTPQDFPDTPPTNLINVYTAGKKLRYMDDTGTSYEVSTGLNLPLDGGIMSGDIDMGNNSLTKTNEMVMIPNASPNTPPANNVTLFSNDKKLYYRDDTGTNYELGIMGMFLPLSGGTMTGDLTMNANINMTNRTINDVKELVLQSNELPSTPVIGNLTVFTVSGKLRIKDSNGDDVQMASLNDLAYYLPLGGGIMNGTLDMASQNITNVLALSYLDVVVSAPTEGASMYYNGGSMYYINDESTISELATLTNVLALSGGTMTGGINMNSQAITNTGSLSMVGNIDMNNHGIDDVKEILLQSNELPSTPAIGSLNLFTVSNTLRIMDSDGVDHQIASLDDLSSYLLLSGGIMTGTLDMGSQSITNVLSLEMKGDIAMNYNSINDVKELVLQSNELPSTPVIGSLVVFTVSGKLRIMDSNGDNYQMATIADISEYLPRAGGFMDGFIDMQNNSIRSTNYVNYLDNVPSAPESGVNLYYHDGSMFYINDASVVTELTTLTNALPVSGGTMTGSIDMDGHSVTNVNETSFVDNGLPDTPAADHVTLYSSGNKLRYIDDSATSYEIANVTQTLALTGGTMTGILNMGTNAIANASSVNYLDSVPSAPSSGANLYYNGGTMFYINDASITTELATMTNTLPLTGGTMGGGINMGGNSVLNMYDASFNDNPSPNTPEADQVVLYSLGKKLRYMDDTETSYEIANVTSTLALSGGTMTGSIDMNSQSLTNLNQTILIPNVSPSLPDEDQITLYSSLSKLRYMDSTSTVHEVATVGGLSAYLSRGGGTMTGAINMGNNNITNTKSLFLANNASPDTVPTDNVLLYTSGDRLRYKDDTASVFQVATTTDLNSYLPLAGGTMSGNITMNGSSLLGVLSVTPSTTSIRIGTSTTAIVDTIQIGNNIGLTGNCYSAMVFGNANNLSNVTQSILIGSTIVADGKESVIVGNASVAMKQRSVILGAASSAQGTLTNVVGYGSASAADSAHIFGCGLSNTTANSILFEGGSNMRSNSTNTTDLGTAAARFKDLHLAGSLVGSTNTRTVNNIVSNAGASIANRIAIFSDTSGKIIADGGQTISQLANLAGASFTGGINGTTANFTGQVSVPRIVSSGPAAYSIYGTGGAIVGMTAGSPRSIELKFPTNATPQANPASVWTTLTTGGSAPLTYGASQYSDTVTRWYLIRVLFNILPLASDQTYTAWISKNDSSTENASRAMNFKTTTPVGYTLFEVSNIYEISNGNTVQLYAKYSASANVNIFDWQLQCIPLA